MTTGMAGAAAGTATGDRTAADAGFCASRSHEVQLLAARLAACAEQTQAVLSRLSLLELQSWQSPAGRAYRAALALQSAALRRSRDELQDAVATVLRHARSVAHAPGRPGP